MIKILSNSYYSINVDKCVSCFFIYPRIPQWHSILMSYIRQNAQLPYLIHRICARLLQELSIFTAFCRNFYLWCDAAGATLFIYFLLLKCTSSCDTSTSKNLSFKIENTRKMYQKNENGGEEAT